MWDDFLNPSIAKVFGAKSEEEKVAAIKDFGDANVKFSEDFATKCLGATKFLCGDEVTMADFCCAGFYTNMA